MLDALPPLEAAFYGSNANVGPPDAERGNAISGELEAHYGFFDGDATERSRYVCRLDRPGDMWASLPRASLCAQWLGPQHSSKRIGSRIGD